MSLQTNAFPGFIPEWSNLEVLHRNTLPARAHFYNYDSVETALTFDREQGQFQSLNGSWKFHYDLSPFEAPSWDDAANWTTIEGSNLGDQVVLMLIRSRYLECGICKAMEDLNT